MLKSMSHRRNFHYDELHGEDLLTSVIMRNHLNHRNLPFNWSESHFSLPFLSTKKNDFFCFCLFLLVSLCSTALHNRKSDDS